MRDLQEEMSDDQKVSFKALPELVPMAMRRCLMWRTEGPVAMVVVSGGFTLSLIVRGGKLAADGRYSDGIWRKR